MSNTGDSAAYILGTIPFLYPKLGSFSDMEQLLLLPTCLLGLESPQALRKTNSNAVFYLFRLQLGQTKRSHCMLAPTILSKKNVSATHQSAWVGSLKPHIAWVGRGLRPSLNPICRGTPSFKISPYSLFRPKRGRNTISVLAIFTGLSFTTITQGSNHTPLV